MLAKYEPSKSKSSFNSNNSHNYQMDKFENRTPTLYNKGSSKANGRSFSSPKNNDFEFGNKGSSLLPRQNTFDPFQEMRNHQMQIFKEFDNLHKNVFGKFDEMFDIMPHKSLFKGFDSIEKEMKDLMSFSNGNSKIPSYL